MINQLLLIDISDLADMADRNAAAGLSGGETAPVRSGRRSRRRAAPTRAERAAAHAATVGSGSWQLDTATCETGRRGVARARQALRAARSETWAAAAPGTELPAAA
ncbi:MAG: hypothetical protein OXE79_03525 [Acidimicrobiaceae bacterium]|nr:hypothetical protein [Acidimicrobiaceae bacterium]MCY4279501.1 hypothetical protein [Acidimicrobiaceae bacterium]MCY4294475.1 hypothetical protein [Acidimicrobiaceae bacterium]